MAAALLIGSAVVTVTGCGGPAVTFRNDSTVETLDVEVAETPGERTRGLMGRTNLPADSGMLFDFGTDVNSTFWMKNTSIPLSICFVDSKGKVIEIEDLRPFDETPVKPEGKYRYAVEANRGWFSEHQITPGFTMSVNR